jgi:hypothetical protein
MGSGHSKIAINDETFGDDGQFKVHIKLFEGFNTEERHKLRAACQQWVETWQSSEFKNWLLTFHFANTNYTNQDIYNKLVGGVSGVKVVDNHADIEIWGKHDTVADSTSISTTFVHDGKEWGGSPHLMNYTVAKLAGYLVFDFCRHEGFLHAGFSEERSVPFAVAKETKRLIEAATPMVAAQSTSVKNYEKDFNDMTE